MNCLIAWSLLLGLYFLLAGEVSWAEAGAGVVCASLATALLAAVRRCGERSFDLAAPWPKIVGRTCASLGIDTARVGVRLAKALVRPGHGHWMEQAFVEGGCQPEEAGRRALVTLATSMAPNGFVADIPDGGHTMLVHSLAPAKTHPDRRWPL